jgi:hypothetical protein
MLSFDMILRRATPRDVPTTPSAPRLADAPATPAVSSLQAETPSPSAPCPRAPEAREAREESPDAAAASFRQALMDCRARWAADVARYGHEATSVPCADRHAPRSTDRSPAPHWSEQARIARLSGEALMPPREREVFTDQTIQRTPVPTGDQPAVVAKAVSWWD